MASTPSFEPPTHEEPMRTQVRPLNYFRLTHANSIVRVNGVFQSIRTPSAAVIDAAGVEGTDYFRGGRVYPLTNGQALDLEDAGFTVSHFPMRTWFAALRNRGAAAAKVIVIGDSISEGVAAGGWTNRWQYLVQQQVRNRLGTNAGSGLGYIPALSVTGSPGPPVTTGGSASASFVNEGLGIKRYRVNNSGPGFVQWDAQTCDKVRVHWAKANFLAGNATVSIDGVDQVTLSSGDANNIDGQVWDSGALTPGSHTVKVRGINTFGFPITACEFFNGDFDLGFRIYDGAHFGANTGSFITAAADTGHWLVVATIQPQVIIINLGTNDTGNTVAGYKANMTSIVTKARAAAPNAVIVLTKGYRAGSVTQDKWDTFLNALDEIVAATPNCTILDLQASWPRLTTDGTHNAGLMIEGTFPIHPNSVGHQFYADVVTEFLCPTGAIL